MRSPFRKLESLTGISSGTGFRDILYLPVPQLTQRQLDCLLFVANGKSDWAIGKILGLSPATVHQHVGDAMRRYSVATRTQLVVRALFDSQICYNEALRR